MEKVVCEAIKRARQAYEKVFSDAGLDDGYYPLNLCVYVLGEDYGVLERVSSEVYPHQYRGDM